MLVRADARARVACRAAAPPTHVDLAPLPDRHSGGSNCRCAAKQYLFEGGIRVNAFVHSPLINHAARGTVYPHIFHVSDWLPTLLHGVLQAAPDLTPADLDGVDHWLHMTRETDSWQTPPRTELLHNIDKWSLEGAFTNVSILQTAVQGIRVGDMKLLMGQVSVCVSRCLGRRGAMYTKGGRCDASAARTPPRRSDDARAYPARTRRTGISRTRLRARRPATARPDTRRPTIARTRTRRTSTCSISRPTRTRRPTW